MKTSAPENNGHRNGSAGKTPATNATETKVSESFLTVGTE
jgi:hypothetical protein